MDAKNRIYVLDWFYIDVSALYICNPLGGGGCINKCTGPNLYQCLDLENSVKQAIFFSIYTV